jgi:hypothetical protein
LRYNGRKLEKESLFQFGFALDIFNNLLVKKSDSMGGKKGQITKKYTKKKNKQIMITVTEN